MKKLASIIAIAFMLAIIPELAYGQWSFETVDTAGDVGRGCAIAVDAHGHPHISYILRDLDGTTLWWLKYTHWDGAEWQIAFVETTTVVWNASIAVDGAGNPHIAFCKGYDDHLWYAFWDGTAWQQEQVDALSGTGEWNSIAIDTDGYPHIAYTYLLGFDWTYLKYAYKDAVGWHTVIADSIEGFNRIKFCDMALDGMDNPHISYYDASVYDLKYAHWDGADWHVETVDSTPWVIGEFSSIAIDSLNYPHISYTHATDHAVKYARWDGSAWQIETVIAEIGGGDHTSLALDANDRPHISFEKRMSYLGFAYWDGSVWQIEVVDDAVRCGWTSLAIDDAGYIHIAYYNEHWDDAEDLKYARRISTGIEETYPISEVLHLVQNYPNPFRERTVISYQLPGVGTGLVPVRLKIYDISGSLVRTLVDQDLKPDTYHLSWDGRDEQGMEVNSGVYFSHLEAGGVKDTKKMILLR